MDDHAERKLVDQPLPSMARQRDLLKRRGGAW